MTKIDHLDKNKLLAKGNERLCYIHPEDETKVIKITHKKGGGRSQNKMEANYYACLEQRGTPMTHLADCYGWVEVEGEKGLMFERVSDADGQTSKTLNEMIKEQSLTLEEIKALLQELIDYIEREKIVFVDSSFDNIVVQQSEDGSQKLVIIDGLGGRRLGWKSWLYCHLPLYLNYKVKQQRETILKNLQIALSLYGQAYRD